MSGRGDENIFEGLGEKPKCEHRALQLCKVQDDVMTLYVCGKCALRFQVHPVRPAPQLKAPMYPKHKDPWGLRRRQA